MLIESLRQSGILDPNENSKVISTPTGFTAIDLLGATIERNEDFMPILNQGVCNKFYMNTGESGTGKSTLQIQSKCYGVDYWNSLYPETEPSDLIIIDSEDFTTSNRVIQLSGWDSDYLNRHLSLRKDTDIKDIYNLILKIADAKAKNKKNYYVETDIIDITGEKVKTWIPTFILIDSLAAIKAGIGLENVNRDKAGEIKQMDISQNIDAMRDAKDNTGFIMKVKPLCNAYGINLSIINHITKDNTMSMFDVPKRYLITLKPGERLRGGYELIYQAYGIDRISLKEKLTANRNPVYGENVEGGIMEYVYLKSKNKGEGIPYRMVMDKNSGYRPELSDFEHLYANNYGFKGSGIGISLDILPEIKFSRSTLLEKCHKNPELARALQFTAKMHIINTLLLGKSEGPSLNFMEDLSYDERIAYIFSFTNRYPGYGHYPISEEVKIALEHGRTLIPNEISSMNSSYMDEMMMYMISSQSELNPSFIPPVSNKSFQFPTDDPNDFTLLDNEFWIKK